MLFIDSYLAAFPTEVIIFASKLVAFPLVELLPSKNYIYQKNPLKMMTSCLPLSDNTRKFVWLVTK